MKKIIEFIFEDVPVDEYKTDETEEVVVEAPVTRHTFKEKTKTVNKTPERVEPVVRETVVNKTLEETKETDKVKEVKESPKKSNFGIDLNNVTPKVEKTKIEIKRSTNRTATKKETGYVSQPNISPMFGLVSSDNVATIKTVEMHTKEDAKVESGSKIGTIFSPFYGAIEPKNDENIEIEKFPDINKIGEVNEEISEEIPAAIEESDDEANGFKGVNNYDDINVEDILAKPSDETYINAEEISLFDDLD